LYRQFESHLVRQQVIDITEINKEYAIRATIPKVSGRLRESSKLRARIIAIFLNQVGQFSEAHFASAVLVAGCDRQYFDSPQHSRSNINERRDYSRVAEGRLESGANERKDGRSELRVALVDSGFRVETDEIVRLISFLWWQTIGTGRCGPMSG
jgi:hypothetical protein